MKSIATTITVTHNGIDYDCDIDVSANVISGGSNSYGSDDPAWVELDSVVVTNHRGAEVSKKFLDKISAKQWERIEVDLIESF